MSNAEIGGLTMSTLFLTGFFVAGVFTAYTTFLMLITWPNRKNARYKQVKYFGASISSAAVLFLLFWVTADDHEFIPAEMMYATPESLSTVEEQASWHITSELGQVTVDHNDVIRNLEFVENNEEQFTELHASLTTEDNVTTELIRSSTMNRTARVLQRLSQIEEVDIIHLNWDLYYEPEYGPGEFDTILEMTVFNEQLRNIEWESLEQFDAELIATEYWEKPELSAVVNEEKAGS